MQSHCLSFYPYYFRLLYKPLHSQIFKLQSDIRKTIFVIKYMDGTAFVQLTSSSISVSRKVTYDGLYIPSKQIFWKEEINGTSYSGTLTLKRQSYDAELNKTTATYEGILISR